MSASSAPARRALGLDALRGFAILTMALSARIPFAENWLPGWMYHGQEGPNPLWYGAAPPGMTWVDLVFPMFLFAMGAAFPFALSRRLAKGATPWQLVPGIVQRYVFLVFFSVYLENTIPYHLGGGVYGNAMGFLAFLLLFPMFTRFPARLPRPALIATRAVGFAAGIVLLWSLRFPGGGRFSLDRADQILMVLANMALFGSILWLATRRNWTLRLAIGLGVGLLGHFSLPADGRITLGVDAYLNFLNGIPYIGWFFKLLYFKYACTVIPGTIIGDMLLSWMKGSSAPTAGRWSSSRLSGLAVLMTVIAVFALTGYKGRWEILTPAVLVALSALGFLLLLSPSSDTERLVRSLYLWGVAWLIVGMITEPLEGGVKKTPSTLSYYFLPLALSIFLLLAFTVWTDVLQWNRTFWLLTSNGQNPMIAYAGIRGLLGPFHFFTGIDAVITEPIFRFSAWLGALWGLFKTVTLALFVGLCTGLRIFWRS